MRKIVLVFLILALSAGSALALDMEAKSFYAQGIFALPTGDWSDAAGNGFGGGIGGMLLGVGGAMNGTELLVVSAFRLE